MVSGDTSLERASVAACAFADDRASVAAAIADAQAGAVASRPLCRIG